MGHGGSYLSVPPMLTKIKITSLLLALGLSGLVRAADGSDPDLPQPLDASVGNALLQSSPFTRTLNFSDALTLTGIAYIDGKPVATITEKATKKSYVVSSKELNEKGWKLAEADAEPELRQTHVKLQVGSEVFTVRYGDQQIDPTAGKRGPMGARGVPLGTPSTSNGQTYFKSSSLLVAQDYDRYRAFSDAGREKFRNIIKDHTEKMLNYTPEQRANYAKKILEVVAKGEAAATAKK